MSKIFLLQDERLGDSVIFSNYSDMLEVVRNVLNDMYMYEVEKTKNEIEEEKNNIISSLDYEEIEEENLNDYSYSHDYRK